MANILEKARENEFRKTGASKKLTINGRGSQNFPVYAIPLDLLYYNDKNGRINTSYKQYRAEHPELQQEPGSSEYNDVLEELVFQSNKGALKETLRSIREKKQQEPGVVLPDGRVIDGNRRFTALRIEQRETNVSQFFEAIILDLDDSNEEKTIKALELDLQLGREERVDYNPIDRIYDVYNTIKVTKLMTPEEYKIASGAGNVKGINKDISRAKLILRFIQIVSPGGNPIDKFYLARELKLDGPIEEIEGTLSKLRGAHTEEIKDAVLTTLAVIKSVDTEEATTPAMRDLKTNILRKSDVLDHFIDAVDDKIDPIQEAFEARPIKKASDLKRTVAETPGLLAEVNAFKKSTDRLVFKGKTDSKRTKALDKLVDIRDQLDDISADDFKLLKTDENFDAKTAIQEISDILFKLKKDLSI